MMNFQYGFFGAFGWFFMVLWWVFIVVVIIALLRWISERQKNDNNKKSPLEVLKERYAKGEIDKKEFEEKKKDLL
ncbi:MAG: SHOCT domain-containing protein [Candidatus Paceibacterota bacterium]